MNVWQETTSGTLDVVSGQSIEKLLAMADDELQQHGSPPTQFAASFTDGNGHVYRGTLYLVVDEQQGGPQK